MIYCFFFLYLTMPQEQLYYLFIEGSVSAANSIPVQKCLKISSFHYSSFIFLCFMIIWMNLFYFPTADSHLEDYYLSKGKQPLLLHSLAPSSSSSFYTPAIHRSSVLAEKGRIDLDNKVNIDVDIEADYRKDK